MVILEARFQKAREAVKAKLDLLGANKVRPLWMVLAPSHRFC